MAEPHRHGPLLRERTAAHLARLVCPPAAARLPCPHRPADAGRRAGGPPAGGPAAPLDPPPGADRDAAADRHHPHRQLCLPQLSGAGARRPARRRRRLGAPRFQAGGRLPGRPAAPLAPGRRGGGAGLGVLRHAGGVPAAPGAAAVARPGVANPFRYKPQDPMRAPGIYAPYQPRFEWNLWFASLASWESEPWVLATEARLLAAEPAVLSLFAADPLRGTRPRAVRAVLWQYWFTDRATRARTGAWWRRHYLGLYAPQLDDSTAPPPHVLPGGPAP